jgi:hypothetical protein
VNGADSEVLSAATSILAKRGDEPYRCDPEVLWFGLSTAPRSRHHLLQYCCTTAAVAPPESAC